MPAKKRGAAGRGKSLGLSRQQIVATAVAFADEHGTEALSMRQLAGELGCGVMSLYNHVSDKDELIHEMVDAVAAEIELPKRKATRDTWLRDLRYCIISAYKAMLNHRWAAKVWGRGLGPAKNRYHEAILRVLRESGFSEELSCRGFHALTMHVVGFAMQVLDMPFNNNDELRKIGKGVLNDLSAEEYPYMIEHIHFHLDGRDKRNDFKYMLDLILEGLERDRDDK